MPRLTLRRALAPAPTAAPDPENEAPRAPLPMFRNEVLFGEVAIGQEFFFTRRSSKTYTKLTDPEYDSQTGMTRGGCASYPTRNGRTKHEYFSHHRQVWIDSGIRPAPEITPPDTTTAPRLDVPAISATLEASIGNILLDLPDAALARIQAMTARILGQRMATQSERRAPVGMPIAYGDTEDEEPERRPNWQARRIDQAVDATRLRRELRVQSLIDPEPARPTLRRRLPPRPAVPVPTPVPERASEGNTTLGIPRQRVPIGRGGRRAPYADD